MKLSTQNLFKFIIGIVVIFSVIYLVQKRTTKKTIVLKDANGNEFTGEIKTEKVKKTTPVSEPTPEMRVA